MKAYLKSTLFISFFLFFSLRVFAIPADTLRHKTSFDFTLRYGVAAYNTLTLGLISGPGDEYEVRSKSKSYFEANLAFKRKRNRFTLGYALLQSSFTGRPYSVGTGYYNGLRYSYYYNLYQRINYDVFYAFIGYGRDIPICKRHTITPSVNVFIPTVYKLKIDNNYAEQQSYDTTLFSLARGASNHDTNPGYFPRLNLGLSYQYNPVDRVGINISISCLYALSYSARSPDYINYHTSFKNSSNYSFVAYDIRKQFAIIPSIGVNIKLN